MQITYFYYLFNKTYIFNDNNLHFKNLIINII